MVPFAMTPKRVATRSSWSSTCELMTMVTPNVSFSRTSRLRMARVPSGSRPFRGSSSRSKSGEPISASARPSRCFMPSENPRAFFLPVSGSPTSASVSRQRAGASTTPMASAFAIRFS